MVNDFYPKLFTWVVLFFLLLGALVEIILSCSGPFSRFISNVQILQCLTVQSGNSSGGAPADSGLSRATVKDRFKTFNVQFEELHQRQSQWTIPDSELRESLRLAVAEVLLPAYRSFVKRFGHVSNISEFVFTEKRKKFFVILYFRH